MIVEFSQFNLEEGSNVEEFLEAIELSQDFIEDQPGFVDREVLRSGDEWFDIIRWESKEHAEAATKKFDTAEEVEDFA
ncbi:MAG: hypothetical protein GOV02_00575, partial [Candidatus Aenigmarchaeota archaeon]|nr:hypothetical protein [Candidatus Aenigmarchaeota archaeon]